VLLSTITRTTGTIIALILIITASAVIYQEALQIPYATAKGDISNPQIGAARNGFVFVVWSQSSSYGEDILVRRIDQQNTTEVNVLHQNSAETSSPKIAVSENGKVVYVVWRDSEGIVLATSTNSGQNFTSHSINSTDGTPKTAPLQISTSGHNVYVTWLDYQPETTNQKKIWLESSTNDGRNFSKATNLFPGKNLNIGLNFASNLNLASSGHTVDVLLTNRTSYYSYNLVLIRSTDYGAHFKDTNSIPINTAFRNPAPSIAAVSNNVYIVWIAANVNSSDSVFFKASKDSGSTFGRSISLNNGTNFPYFPVVTGEQIANFSHVYVAWEGREVPFDIYLTVSIDAAHTFMREADISQDGGFSIIPDIVSTLGPSNQPNPDVYLVWWDNTAGDHIFFTKGRYEAPHYTFSDISDVHKNGISLNSIHATYVILTVACVVLVLSIIFLIRRLRNMEISKQIMEIKLIYEDTAGDKTDVRKEKLKEKKEKITKLLGDGTIRSVDYHILKQKIDAYLFKIGQSNELPDQDQTRLADIIKKHKTLMKKYDEVLSSANNLEGILLTSCSYEGANPSPLILDRSITLSERLHLLTSLLIMKPIFVLYFIHDLFVLFRKKRPTKYETDQAHQKRFTRIAIRPFVLYFLKSHIRRQLVKLKELYLRELAYLEPNAASKDQIAVIRDIVSDVEKYIDAFPGPKRLVGGLVGALAFIASIAAIIEFLGLKITIIPHVLQLTHSSTKFSITRAYFIPDYLSAIIFVLIIAIVSIIMLIIIVKFTNNGFRIKRTMFLESNSIYHYMDIYSVEKDEHLYKQSIYKLEDDLFESLNAMTEKPHEVPEDKIIVMVVATGVIAFLIYFTPFISDSLYLIVRMLGGDIFPYTAYLYGLSSFDFINPFYVPAIQEMQTMGLFILVVILMILAFFLIPYSQYKRRKVFQVY
jgi:hypothetical protein